MEESIKRVPQGGELTLIMFLIYINDILEGLDTYIILLADDTKILKQIVNIFSCKELQEDLDKLLFHERLLKARHLQSNVRFFLMNCVLRKSIRDCSFFLKWQRRWG